MADPYRRFFAITGGLSTVGLTGYQSLLEVADHEEHVGVGLVGATTVRMAWRQRHTPPELLGRTIGAAPVLNFGLMPLGALTAGRCGGGGICRR